MEEKTKGKKEVKTKLSEKSSNVLIRHFFSFNDKPKRKKIPILQSYWVANQKWST